MELLGLCQASRNLVEVIELDFERECVSGELVTGQAFNEFRCYMIQFYDDRGLGRNILFQCMLASYGLAYSDGLYRP